MIVCDDLRARFRYELAWWRLLRITFFVPLLISSSISFTKILLWVRLILGLKLPLLFLDEIYEVREGVWTCVAEEYCLSFRIEVMGELHHTECFWNINAGSLFLLHVRGDAVSHLHRWVLKHYSCRGCPSWKASLSDGNLHALSEERSFVSEVQHFNLYRLLAVREVCNPKGEPLRDAAAWRKAVEWKSVC